MEIHFNKIYFAYHKKNVLHGVSGKLQKGKFYALIGPNGCGKSTLLKCIDKILEPKSGDIFLNQIPIKKIPGKKLAQKIGYVAQSSHSIFPADVYTTVMMGRKPHAGWLPGQKDRKIVTDIIREMGLEKLILRNLNELSGGEQQRVHIARALAQQPQILLLDEPTSNLDLKFQVEVMEVLKRITEKGITVIMAIHDLNLAIQYAHQFILMKKGKILAQGGKEVIRDDLLSQLYETDIKKLTHNENTYIVPSIKSYLSTDSDPQLKQQ